ncbi:MAG TPA: YaiI/YqxD family protein [Dehalococcoidales bacterium]
MFKIMIDADASPVKQEVYRVARRYGIKVTLVANSAISIPAEDWLELVVVSGQLDAADDWIVDNIEKNDIVITGDIPLASRGMKKGARVLSPKGMLFTESSIGNALATRDLMTHLRETGLKTGGPSAFAKKDRSRFLQALDSLIQAILKEK